MTSWEIDLLEAARSTEVVLRGKILLFIRKVEINYFLIQNFQKRMSLLDQN
jgi:hypothetical protein